MLFTFFVALLLPLVASFSIGKPDTCDIGDVNAPSASSPWGCTTYNLYPDQSGPNHLNCSDTTPGLMHWAYRPVRTTAYTLATADDGQTGPTAYTPGEIHEIHLRVREYERRFRGLMIYAVDDSGNKVGSWSFPTSETLYWSPWTAAESAHCHPVALHQSARIKPFHSILRWVAPPAGTGTITFHTLIKWGDANTGAFFYPDVDLSLTEGATADADWYVGDPGETCTDLCVRLGRQCDATAISTGSDSLTEFSDAFSHVTCAFPLMSSNLPQDHSMSVTDYCHVNDGTQAANTCGAAAGTSEFDNRRVCPCLPDPCEPNPCNVADPMATCTPTGNTEADFTCACSSGWGGTLCDTGTCDLMPCQNGAVCSNTGVGRGYACACDPCYFGENCEIDAPCDTPNLCGQGTCANVLGTSNCSHSCTCSMGWYVPEGGDSCTEADGCQLSSNSCQNGAACSDTLAGSDVDAFQCICEPGWEGRYCERSIDDCLINPCVNGTCTDGHLSRTCACNNVGGCQFSGPDCDCCNCNPCADISPAPCSEDPNAQCVEDATAPAGYHCACAANYYLIDGICQQDPCSVTGANLCNGQTCNFDATAPGGYTCDCGTSCRTGDYCEVPGPCEANPNLCGAFGSCTLSSDGECSTSCTCDSHFSGDACSECDACSANTNADVATCIANGGTCVDGAFGADCNQFTCECPSFRDGVLCETIPDAACCTSGVDACEPCRDDLGYDLNCNEDTGQCEGFIGCTEDAHCPEPAALWSCDTDINLCVEETVVVDKKPTADESSAATFGISSLLISLLQ